MHGQPGRTRTTINARMVPAAWRTARVRISVLFGAGFLLVGVGLLAVANILVQRTAGTTVYTASPSQSSNSPFFRSGADAPADQRIQAQINRLHANDIHQFLIRSGIALAFAVLTAFVLGYFVAGRVLRPVRDITAKAKAISAHNLHERLTLSGPADELKELGDTFDALLERLDHAFRTQRRFIANASHELRTPVTRTLALAEVALGDPAPTLESLRTAHERIIVAAREQERIIEALLMLARGQAGTDRRVPVDLAVVAEHVCETRHDGHSDISLRSDLRHAAVGGDPHLLERLVANLLDNALRYNTANGWVVIKTGVRDRRAVLSVSNSGPMIPADSLPHLTEPFRRLQADRTSSGHSGLGLGLSIVDAIAEAQGADLTMRARDGGGIEVAVAFPAG